MKRYLVFAVFCLIVFSAYPAIGQRTNREELIRVAKKLEAAPFGDEAKVDRSWAMRWVIETDEVSIVICMNEITSPLIDKKNKYGSELLAQYSIAMAAFKLENPANASDEDAAQLAGVESFLRAYEAMLVAKPKARHQKLDDLIAMRSRGELTKEKVGGCAKKSEPK
jgi:hypothetical protein